MVRVPCTKLVTVPIRRLLRTVIVSTLELALRTLAKNYPFWTPHPVMLMIEHRWQNNIPQTIKKSFGHVRPGTLGDPATKIRPHPDLVLVPLSSLCKIPRSLLSRLPESPQLNANIMNTRVSNTVGITAVTLHSSARILGDRMVSPLLQFTILRMFVVFVLVIARLSPCINEQKSQDAFLLCSFDTHLRQLAILAISV